MSKVLKKVAIVAGVVAFVAGTIATGGTLGAFGAVFAKTLAGTFMLVSGVASLVATVASFAAQELAGNKPAVASQNLRDRLNVSIDVYTPRKFVFGNTASATDLRDQEWTDDDVNLHRFIVLASHECESVDEIWFDGEQAWTSGGGVDAAFTGYLTVAIVNPGSSGNAINISARMGTTRRFTGLCYAHLTYKVAGDTTATDSPFASGITSRVTFRMKGLRVYDPRLDSTVPGGSGAHRDNDQTTWTYDDSGDEEGRNPALVLLWYLLGWKVNSLPMLGRGVPASRIDMESFITAANICDEAVTLAVGGTEKRYQVDGIGSEGDDPQLIIGGLEAAMNGRLRDHGGKLSLIVFKNDLSSIVAAFEDSDIMGDVELLEGPAQSDIFNVVKGRYVDSSDEGLYQFTEYPSVRLTSDDAIDRFDQFDQPFVQSASQAQRLAKQHLQRNLYRKTLVADFQITGWKVQKDDIVTLTFSAYGYSAKLFRVVEQVIQLDGICTMVLREEHADLYAWDAEESAAVVPAAASVFDPANSPIIQTITASALTADWPSVTDTGGTKPADNATADDMNTLGATSLFINSEFNFPAPDGVPALVYAGYGTTVRSVLQTSPNGGLRLYDPAETDTQFGAYTFAVPINASTKYQIDIKHIAEAANAAGLYIRICEYSGVKPYNARIIEHTVNALSEDANAPTATSVKDIITNGATFTSEQDVSYEYVPTAGTKWMSIVFVNGVGVPATEWIDIRLCSIRTKSTVGATAGTDFYESDGTTPYDYWDFENPRLRVTWGNNVLNLKDDQGTTLDTYDLVTSGGIDLGGIREVTSGNVLTDDRVLTDRAVITSDGRRISLALPSEAAFSTLDNRSVQGVLIEDDMFYADEAAFEEMWESSSDNGEIAPGTSIGYGNHIRFGNNSGNDQQWMHWKGPKVPYKLGVLYEVTFIARTIDGTGNFYAGVDGFAADGTTRVNINGDDAWGSQHYIAANSTLTSAWSVHKGYIKGRATTGNGALHNDPADPATAHDDVMYIAPMFIVNFNAVAGRMDIALVRLREINPAAIGSMIVDTDGSTILGQNALKNANNRLAVSADDLLLKDASGNTFDTLDLTNALTSSVVVDRGDLMVLDAVALDGATTTGTLPESKAVSTLKNATITITSGTLNGIGTAGIKVDNTAITVASGVLTGIGTASILVDNARARIDRSGSTLRIKDSGGTVHDTFDMTDEFGLDVLDSTADTKLTGIEANATVGADFSTNVTNRPGATGSKGYLPRRFRTFGELEEHYPSDLNLLWATQGATGLTNPITDVDAYKVLPEVGQDDMYLTLAVSTSTKNFYLEAGTYILDANFRVVVGTDTDYEVRLQLINEAGGQEAASGFYASGTHDEQIELVVSASGWFNLRYHADRSGGGNFTDTTSNFLPYFQDIYAKEGDTTDVPKRDVSNWLEDQNAFTVEREATKNEDHRSVSARGIGVGKWTDFNALGSDGKPIGLNANYGGTQRSMFQASPTGNGVRLYDSGDSTTGMTTDAFPVKGGVKLRITVKIIGDVADTNGLYVGAVELNDVLDNGNHFISWSASSEAGGQNPPDVDDWFGASHVVSGPETTLTNTDVPTTEATYVVEYTPGDDAKMMGLQFLNWSGSTSWIDFTFLQIETFADETKNAVPRMEPMGGIIVIKRDQNGNIKSGQFNKTVDFKRYKGSTEVTDDADCDWSVSDPGASWTTAITDADTAGDGVMTFSAAPDQVADNEITVTSDHDDTLITATLHVKFDDDPPSTSGATYDSDSSLAAPSNTSYVAVSDELAIIPASTTADLDAFMTYFADTGTTQVTLRWEKSTNNGSSWTTVSTGSAGTSATTTEPGTASLDSTATGLTAEEPVLFRLMAKLSNSNGSSVNTGSAQANGS